MWIQEVRGDLHASASRWRFTAPVLSAVAHALFFLVLPFTGYATHWLNAEDVVQATNGPAYAAYNLALGKLMALPIKSSLESVTTADHDMLRNHVASFYLGHREFAR